MSASTTETLYLGKQRETGQELRLKPSALRTHGVVVGMTGSGKTGLCLVLLEELLNAGVPIIALDPKGDLGNLGLLFPNLAAEEFKPWCGKEDPAGLASRYQEGLKSWNLGSAQVARLRERMALTVYTPGSEAGVPVNLLGSFQRPPEELLHDDEARRELVADLVSGLLGLVGRTIDPVKDPAHVVMCQLLTRAWEDGEDPDLESLILRLVDPPFAKVGVFPLDKFFPPDERMKLAMAFNAVAASPSFVAWTRGMPLDAERMLKQGPKTPVSIFSLAHLEEGERQLFVSMLLGRVLAWSRAQPGTEDLRAIVFFDEVAGYLPPYPQNPASKGPLLTLMKQARAVGVGVVLATQNPVDLDYKALSNAGLWCIGRLSTAQDRERLLKGIEGQNLEGLVSGLERRQFLLHQASGEKPAMMNVRHALCYLKGPFTRVEIARLNAAHKVVERLRGSSGASSAAETSSAAGVSSPAGVASAAETSSAAGVSGAAGQGGRGRVAAQSPAGSESDASASAGAWGVRVARATGASGISDGLLPEPQRVPGFPAFFLNPETVFSAHLRDAFQAQAKGARPDGLLEYHPALLADVVLRFDEEKVGFFLDQHLYRVWFPLGKVLPRTALTVAFETEDLHSDVPRRARYQPLPTWMDEEKELKKLAEHVVEELFRTETTGMFVHRGLKLYGRAGETREAFVARCRQAAEAAAELEMNKVSEKYKKELDRLQDRVERKQAELAEQEGVARSRQLDEAVTFGTTLLSFFSGRKPAISKTMNKRAQTARAGARLSRVEQELADLQEEADALQARLDGALQEAFEKAQALAEQVEEQPVRLEKNDVQLRAFGILWVPVTRRI
ncbi:MAG: helicase HerA-like domain-containing protein [Myxococcota bacterium]